MARASPLLRICAHRYSHGQNRQTSRFESRALRARFDLTDLITLKSKAPDSNDLRSHCARLLVNPRLGQHQQELSLCAHIDSGRDQLAVAVEYEALGNSTVHVKLVRNL